MSDLLSIADLPEGAFMEILALSERQEHAEDAGRSR